MLQQCIPQVYIQALSGAVEKEGARTANKSPWIIRRAGASFRYSGVESCQQQIATRAICTAFAFAETFIWLFAPPHPD